MSQASEMPRPRTASQLGAMLFCIVGGFANVTSVYMATFPVMLKAMQPEFGGSRTGLTLGYSAMVVSLAAAGPFVGRMIDRHGQRRVLLVGILGLSLSLAAFYVLPPTLPAYALLCMAVGLFGAATYQFVYYSILPSWFDRGLGLALGLAGAGVALGLALVPQFADAGLRHFGWRSTYLLLAGAAATIGLLNLLFFHPRAQSRAVAAHAADASDGLPISDVLRTGLFWKLAASYFLLCAMVNGNVVHLVAMLTDRGVDAVGAARSMAYLGVANLAGRVLSGVLLLRFEARRLGALLFLLGAAGATLLIWASAPGSIALAVVLIGLALGVEGEMLNFMARRVFGMRAHGAVLGALSTAFLLGVLAGPLLLSVYRDVAGDYLLMQVALVLAGVIASALHLGVRTSRAPRTESPVPSPIAEARGPAVSASPRT